LHRRGDGVVGDGAGGLAAESERERKDEFVATPLVKCSTVRTFRPSEPVYVRTASPSGSVVCGTSAPAF
jgi:hypothetical protein